jgi:hypothetical protein
MEPNILKCPKKNIQYIVPTTEWLEPIKELMHDEIGNDGILIISKLLAKEKIIVKITRGINNKIVVINNLLNKIKYNYVKTYCSFFCNEDNNKLSLKYKNSIEFCSINKDNISLVTLELMKRYKRTLSSFENKFYYDKFIIILKQLLLAQIVAYQTYGFVHNDLHNANILVNIYDDEKDISYMIRDNVINIKTNIEIIICDFGNSCLYDQKYYSEYDENFMWINGKINTINFNEDYTLISNLLSVINSSITLLNLSDTKYNFVKNSISEFINGDWVIDKRKVSRKNLKALFKRYYTYEYCNRRELTNSIILINSLFKILSNSDVEVIPYFDNF